MASVLKGNFTPKTDVTVDTQKELSLEERFEMEALKKLGGSMAVVLKKKVLWDLDK